MFERIYAFSKSIFIVFWVQAVSVCTLGAQGNQMYIIDSLLLSPTPMLSLNYLDSLLKLPQELGREKTLNIKRLESLKNNKLYPEFLEFSKILLEKYDRDTLSMAQIRLKKALVYELLEEFPACLLELNQTKILLRNYQTTPYYADLLVRFSSYYRCLGDKENSSKYAKTASILARKQHFGHPLADSNMLLAHFCSSSETKLKLDYLHEALHYFKEIHDFHGVIGMYYRIAKVFLLEKNYDKVIIYADSSIHFTMGTYSELTAYNYKLKSESYEHLYKNDSALACLKQYIVEEERSTFFQHQQAVKKLEYETINKIQQRELKSKNLINQSLRQNNHLLLLLSICLGISIVLVLYLLFQFRQTNKTIRIKNRILDTTNVELKKMVDFNKLLVKELHHRIKNNLALIISLIEFQAINSISKETKKSMFSLKNRINTISSAYELLLINYNDVTNQENIHLKTYIEHLVAFVLSLEARKIDVEMYVEEAHLNADTCIPMGILLNELISNTLKHNIISEISIKLSIEIKDKKIIIQYEDNGIGFKEKKQGLGTVIIQSMVKQLNGTIQREKSKYSISLCSKETF